MSQKRQFSAAVKVCVGVVLCLGVMAFFLAGDTLPMDSRGHFLVVLALSALIGLHSMRFTSRSMELSSSHPFLIYSIATFGSRASMLIILTGLAATLLAGKARQPALRVVFNLSAVGLSTACAGAVFHMMGGVPGQSIDALMAPLFGAATSYLVTNSVLIALIVSMDRKDMTFLKAFADSFRWAGVAYLTGYAIGVAVLYATAALGPSAILLILPPVWLLLSFYRLHESRVEAERFRANQVRALNSELMTTIDELHEAMLHIKQLGGLLPICMHCHSIRDDKDVWHRIEAYIAEHTDAHLTHSLCENCKSIHYPEVAAKKPEPVGSGS